LTPGINSLNLLRLSQIGQGSAGAAESFPSAEAAGAAEAKARSQTGINSFLGARFIQLPFCTNAAASPARTDTTETSGPRRPLRHAGRLSAETICEVTLRPKSDQDTDNTAHIQAFRQSTQCECATPAVAEHSTEAVHAPG
jgi:hypothetical protein